VQEWLDARRKEREAADAKIAALGASKVAVTEAEERLARCQQALKAAEERAAAAPKLLDNLPPTVCRLFPLSACAGACERVALLPCARSLLSF
jgi:hypothetical protein